jgi:NAD(P)-dependent dehydrogenase (short-subunit alcohol dehydrogenase family)
MTSNERLRTFNGATAIVTGGASGIGRALAEALARRGCEVVVVDLQFELREEVASGDRASGGMGVGRPQLGVRDKAGVNPFL